MPDAAVDHVTNAPADDPAMNGVFFIQLKLDASLFGLGGRRTRSPIRETASKR